MATRIDAATGEAKQFGEAVIKVMDPHFESQHTALRGGKGPYILNYDTVVVSRGYRMDRDYDAYPSVSVQVEYNTKTHEMCIKRYDTIDVEGYTESGYPMENKFTREHIVGRYDLSDRPYDTTDLTEVANACQDAVDNPPSLENLSQSLPFEVATWMVFEWDEDLPNVDIVNQTHQTTIII